MRACVLLFACCLVLGGCGVGDCLPVPASDETPPEVRLTVAFTDWTTGRRDSVVLVTPCEDAPAVDADASGEVVVAYAATDAEGMRRLQLGVSTYRSVGVGIQMESFNVPPLTARCPRPTLAGARAFAPSPGKRNLTVSVFAENWTGLRTATPALVVRQRPSTRL